MLVFFKFVKEHTPSNNNKIKKLKYFDFQLSLSKKTILKCYLIQK